MSAITKEWLQQTIAEYEANRDELPFGLDTNSAIELQAFKLALASLEAEPVAYLFAGSATEAAQLGFPDELDDGQKANCTPLYAAPTVPAARVESPDIPPVEPNWNDPTLREPGIWAYGFLEGQKVNLSHPQPEPATESTVPPAPASSPDDIRLLQSEVTIWKDRWELLRELFREVADALGCDVKDNQAMLDKIEMLQGAEPVKTANKLPEPIKDHRLNSGAEADDYYSGYQAGWNELLEAVSGNSPVIPDGYALVPIEPTEDMIVNGFESEPDESFSDEKEWEVYEAMSGCQQAAHRAKLCWAAMISAAPKI